MEKWDWNLVTQDLNLKTTRWWAGATIEVVKIVTQEGKTAFERKEVVPK